MYFLGHSPASVSPQQGHTLPTGPSSLPTILGSPAGYHERRDNYPHHVGSVPYGLYRQKTLPDNMTAYAYNGMINSVERIYYLVWLQFIVSIQCPVFNFLP